MSLPQLVLTEITDQGSEKGAALPMHYLARLPFPLPSVRCVLLQGVELASGSEVYSEGLQLSGCGKGTLK